MKVNLIESDVFTVLFDFCKPNQKSMITVEVQLSGNSEPITVFTSYIEWTVDSIPKRTPGTVNGKSLPGTLPNDPIVLKIDRIFSPPLPAVQSLQFDVIVSWEIPENIGGGLNMESLFVAGFKIVSVEGGTATIVDGSNNGQSFDNTPPNWTNLFHPSPGSFVFSIEVTQDNPQKPVQMSYSLTPISYNFGHGFVYGKIDPLLSITSGGG